jgi:hypothetical protein
LGIAAAHAVSPADKCDAAKNKIAGQYAFCRQKAEATAVKTGGSPDFSKCNAKFSQKWMAAETTGNGMCPTTGDAAAIQTRITTDSGDLAVLLSGGSVPVCGDGVIEAGEQCDFNNLNGKTCQTQGFVAGQLSCTPGTCVFDTSGCFATRFVDNGDGTVTDHLTGLQWEKKDNLDLMVIDADPHDADNSYTWSASGTAPDGTVYTDFLAKLNNGASTDGKAMTPITGCFAGHCDWRLPSIVELQGILDFSAPGCGSGIPPLPCIDPAFGPTQGSIPGYWSAIAYAPSPFAAWVVDFGNGGVFINFKQGPSPWVRAVRGGS